MVLAVDVLIVYFEHIAVVAIDVLEQLAVVVLEFEFLEFHVVLELVAELAFQFVGILVFLDFIDVVLEFGNVLESVVGIIVVDECGNIAKPNLEQLIVVAEREHVLVVFLVLVAEFVQLGQHVGVVGIDQFGFRFLLELLIVRIVVREFWSEPIFAGQLDGPLHGGMATTRCSVRY